MTSAVAQKVPALLDAIQKNEICYDTKPEPIRDIDKPPMQEAGRFAVMEHNGKTGKHLKFKRVVNGLRQKLKFLDLFSFEILHLVVEAINDDGIAWTYETKVLDVACVGFMALLSFKPILNY